MANVRHLPSRSGIAPLGLILALAGVAALLGCGPEPRPAQPRPESPPPAEESQAKPAAAPCGSGQWLLKPGAVYQGVASPASADGDPCGYSFSLEAGLFLELEVDQLGTDLVVEVWDASGAQVLRVDNPVGDRGKENIVLEAARRSEYRLRARPLKEGLQDHFAARVKTLRRATAADRRSAEAWREHSMAEIARRSGAADPATTLLAYQRAIRLLRQSGEKAAAGRAAIDLASLQSKDPRSRQEAIETLELAVALLEGGEDDQWLARALNRLGSACEDLGQLERARAVLERSVSLRRSAGPLVGLGTALSDLAGVLQNQGKFHLAIDLYAEALEIWRKLERPDFEAISRSNLGMLYMNVGNRRQAAVHFRRSLFLLDGDQEHDLLPLILSRLGDARLFLDGPAAALPLYHEALGISKARQNLQSEALVLNSIGIAERKAQQPRLALEALQRSLSIYRAAEQLREGSAVAANLAAALEDLGQLERAREEFERALAWASKTGRESIEVDALHGLARLERARGDRSAAIGLLAEALELVESHRLRPEHRDQRASFVGIQIEVYELMVELLVESEARQPGHGFREQAFEIAERSRVRGLLDPLRRAPDSPALARIEKELDAVSAEINALHRRRLEGNNETPRGGDGSRDDQDDALPLAFERFQQLESQLFNLEKESLAVPTLETVREKLLEPGTLLLAYHLAPDRSFLWSVSSDAVSVHELPGRAPLDKLAADLFARIERQSDPLGRDALDLGLREASRQLLAPAAAEIEKASRLMIIPSGSLKGLPFAVFPHPRNARLPLVESHQVLYLPSVSALAELRSRAAAERTGRPAEGRGHTRSEAGFEDRAGGPANGLAVLADPVVGADDERWRNIRPAAGGASRNRLEFSAREAEQILAAAGSRHKFAATGFAANRDLLLSGRLADFRILHIAAHGTWDHQWPELSSLLLSSYHPDGRPRDGFLRAYEIRRLRLSAELVTLSACETATPPSVGAEGMFGLSRGFFDAGAKSVLMTLWPVHDAATSELMGRFYRHLLEEGQAPARALQRAQSSMRQDPRFSDPFFWAAFVLYGDWRAEDRGGPDGKNTAGGGPLFTTIR